MTNQQLRKKAKQLKKRLEILKTDIYMLANEADDAGEQFVLKDKEEKGMPLMHAAEALYNLASVVTEGINEIEQDLNI